MKYCFVTDDESDYCEFVCNDIPNWYLIPWEKKGLFNNSLTFYALENITKEQFEDRFLQYKIDFDVDNYSFENPTLE